MRPVPSHHIAGVVLLAVVAESALPELMQAVQASQALCSNPDWNCISEKTVAVPRPGTGQVLIEMKGSSVNPINVDLVETSICKHSSFGCSNGIIGNEGSGIVVQTGIGCAGISVGDEVWGFGFPSYAQYAISDCKSVALKPKSLSFVDAGTIPVVGITSLQCMRAAGMPSKKRNLTVVVTSGQGGTGFMGVQLARALGASHIVTSATGSGIDFMKSLGADVVVDYHQQDLFDALPPDSVDMIYDNLGAPGTADKAMPAIRSGGAFLILEGGNGGKISDKPKAGVRQVPSCRMFPFSQEHLNYLANLFDAGSLKPHTMSPLYGLAEVPQAFTRLLSPGVVGKIAVVPSMTNMTNVVLV